MKKILKKISTAILEGLCMFALFFGIFQGTLELAKVLHERNCEGAKCTWFWCVHSQV